MPRDMIRWKYVMEMPYWHDIQQTIEMHGILNKLKHYLPPYILRILYFSKVNAHLNSGVLVWGFVPKRLIKIQQGKSEGFDSDRPSNLTQIEFKSLIFQPVWPWYFMDDLKNGTSSMLL